MIWNYCAACFSRHALSKLEPGLALCVGCLDELQELTIGGAIPPLQTCYDLDLAYLFRYQGLIRQLFLRAKVAGDQRALAVVRMLAARRPECVALVTWADLLVPAPSSLWGRLRGRLDIAGHVAAHLAANHNRRLVSAPLIEHWRWRKNAQRSRAERAETTVQWPSAAQTFSLRRFRSSVGVKEEPPRILIMDDVLTTGATLRRTARSVTSAQGCILRCLALAGP